MPFAIQDFILRNPGGGGANEKLAPHLVADNESAPPDDSTLPLKNCHTDKIGKIVKRKGYSVYGGPFSISATSYTKVNGMFQYRKFSGSTFNVGAVSTGSAQKFIDFTTPGSPSDITGATNFTNDTKFSFAVVADTLIATTENRDTPVKWTGSGNFANLGGSPPAGKYVVEFFNYAFIANTSSNPERVYWSALFDPESWTGTDFKRLEDAVTGLAKRDNILFAFTKNSIHTIQYTGDSLTPFTFERLDTSIGCISHRTIKNIEGVLYWLAGDGHIYRMSGFNIERVTEAIPKTILTLVQSAFSIACAEDHKELRQYWCAVPKSSSSVNDFIIVVDYLNNAIFFYDGFSINCLANFTDSGGIVRTYFGDRTGRVFLTNNGTADYVAGVATAIDYWRYSKVFDFGAPNHRKRFRRLWASVNSGGNYNSQIDPFGDFGAITGQTVALSHGGSGKLLGIDWILGVDPLGRTISESTPWDMSITARYLQLKFYDQSTNAVEIGDIELAYQVYDGKRY